LTFTPTIQQEQIPEAEKHSDAPTLPVLSPLYFAGVIWSRYSLVIIPKNWGLFFVNGFLGLAGANQLVRIWM
jgi:hypothetical protein